METSFSPVCVLHLLNWKVSSPHLSSAASPERLRDTATESVGTPYGVESGEHVFAVTRRLQLYNPCELCTINLLNSELLCRRSIVVQNQFFVQNL